MDAVPASPVSSFADAPPARFVAAPMPAGIPGDGARGMAGDRARQRQRFLAAGAEALADDEMLDLVLSPAVGRGDTRPLTRRLLAAFGDFNGVISAPTARLAAIPGATDAAICALKVVEGAARRLARARIRDRPVMSSWSAVIDYCHTTLAHRDTEQFRVLFLDRKNALIADETQGEGTVDHVPVYPREVVRRALELNACALILVHNHPSGDPTPSGSDIEMTRRIGAAADVLGIALHDHIVVGRGAEVSFRAEGLL